MVSEPAPQPSSSGAEKSTNIPVNLPTGRPTMDPFWEATRGLSVSIHADASHVQTLSHPEPTQARMNPNNSMEVNFMLNPNHSDRWGGTPITPCMSQGDRKRLKIKCHIEAGIPPQGFLFKASSRPTGGLEREGPL